MQFRSKLLSRSQTAVHTNEFHQVDDRLPPIQFLRIFLGHVVEHSSDIYHWSRRSRAGGGAEDPAAAGFCGVPPAAGAAAAACDALAVVAGAAWPKIFDIRLLNNPINLSFLF